MVKRETSACKRVVAASEGGTCWWFDSTPRGKQKSVIESSELVEQR